MRKTVYQNKVAFCMCVKQFEIEIECDEYNLKCCQFICNYAKALIIFEMVSSDIFSISCICCMPNDGLFLCKYNRNRKQSIKFSQTVKLTHSI